LHEIPEKVQFLDSALQQTLSTIADGDAKNRGIGLGKEAGQAILDACANDGSAGNPMIPVPPSNVPGAISGCASIRYCICSLLGQM
jgi:hypothetical protein